MNPEISIVFTSYNHKEYLRIAIDSLLSQTYQDFELIIVDDNSTDGSQEILQDYKDKQNVRLFLKTENSGSYVKASNYGADQAKGRYLLFAQCDDFAEPSQIEALLAAINNHENVGVSFCRSNLIDEKGIVFDDDFRIREKAFRNMCRVNVHINNGMMRRFLSRSCVIPNLSAALIKRELFLKVGKLSTDYLVAADWAFWLALSEECDFFYVAQPLNNFRQHDSTIRNTIKIKKQILEIYTIFYNHINRYKLSSDDIHVMKVGAASIWISYFGQNKKAWTVSFPSLLKSIFKLEKAIVFYLFLGFFLKVKEFIVRDSK